MKKISMNKTKIRKIIVRLLIIALIAGAAFTIIPRLKPKKAESKEVMTSKVITGDVETVITGTGTLSPANQYEVKSLVKGEILEAPFEEGDLVAKDSLLYQISTNEMENGIKGAEIGVEKAKLSYQDVLKKKDKLVMTATDSGYIKKLYVKTGDTLTAGKTIADLYNEDILYLDLLFPAGEVKQSWVGKTASVIMDATQESVKGEVTGVSSMEETMNGGILSKKVTISVKNIGGMKAGDVAAAVVSGIPSNNNNTFQAKTQTSMPAEIEGKIESLNVKEGQWVNKGDTILTLSAKDLESQITTAKLGIEDAELTLKTEKTKMKLYTIKSPIAGQIITKNKKQGDTIDPATDTQAGPMAIVYDLAYLTFQMNIDELQISSIKKGQSVVVTTDNFPGESFDGVIDKISMKGNTNNGVTNYPVTVKVEKFDKLMPGMNVTGKVSIEKANKVLTIPSSALQANNVVYVKTNEAAKDTKNSKDAKNADPSIPVGFKAVTVKIGLNDGANVEIKEGLKEGDEVYVPFDNAVSATYEYN